MGLFSKKKNKEVVNATVNQVQEPKKPFTIADIKDEDMMVAALVATIDFANEKKTDVRLVSIKQIS